MRTHNYYMRAKVKKPTVAELLDIARQRMDPRGPKPEQLGFPAWWGGPSHPSGMGPSYRYTLWRHLGAPMTGRSWPGRTLMVVGLNPSTADAEADDPTLRRVQDFGRTWGFHSLCMTNLYAMRSTDPALLKVWEDPVGPENDTWLERIAGVAETILVAWGAHAQWDRAHHVRQLLLHASGKNGAGLMCLGTTDAGHPRHPLYLAKATPMQPWVPA